jgi:hypothetical protein
METRPGLSLQHIYEFVHSQVRITRDLTQQTWLYGSVIRHSYGEMLWVGVIAKPNAAPSLSNDLVTQAFQNLDYLMPRYDR